MNPILERLLRGDLVAISLLMCSIVSAALVLRAGAASLQGLRQRPDAEQEERAPWPES